MNPYKHKFQPRYDERYTTAIEELSKAKGIDEAEGHITKPYLKEKIYIHDICVKCGTLVCRRLKNEH